MNRRSATDPEHLLDMLRRGLRGFHETLQELDEEVERYEDRLRDRELDRVIESVLRQIKKSKDLVPEIHREFDLGPGPLSLTRNGRELFYDIKGTIDGVADDLLFIEERLEDLDAPRLLQRLASSMLDMDITDLRRILNKFEERMIDMKHADCCSSCGNKTAVSYNEQDLEERAANMAIENSRIGREVGRVSRTASIRLEKDPKHGYMFKIDSMDRMGEPMNNWRVTDSFSGRQMEVEARGTRELRDVIDKALEKPLPDRSWEEVSGLLEGGHTAKINYVPQHVDVYN